ncbi:MAG: cytochrome P450, partial [Chloroflexota bacterium]
GAPRPGYRRSLAQMDAYLYQLIADRRAALECSPTALEHSAAAPLPADMLGLLIASGMEDGLIRDQLLTMLIAGHDTVTALMAWTLYLLGSHPDAYRRAQAEADAVLARGELPGYAQLNGLVYLEQVIREALRLYPPIHLGSRLAAVDLEYDGYRIPAGERVIYSIYLTQRHPDCWPDPDRFDPERHQPGHSPQPYSWLAFGGGPRNCIGAAFGQVEARLVLGYVLRNFSLRLHDRRVTPHMGATLEPAPGVWMDAVRR